LAAVVVSYAALSVGIGTNPRDDRQRQNRAAQKNNCDLSKK